MSDKDTKTSVRVFVSQNFPFINVSDVSEDETSEEFQEAKKLIQSYSRYFNNSQENTIIYAFANIITAIKNKKNLYDRLDADTFSLIGKESRRYHQMLEEFKRLLECFTRGIDQGNEKKNINTFTKSGLFKIKK